MKDVAEANRLALHAVEAGADSIGFDLSEKPLRAAGRRPHGRHRPERHRTGFQRKTGCRTARQASCRWPKPKKADPRNSVYFSASTRSSGSFRSRAPSATATTDSSVTRPSPGSSGGQGVAQGEIRDRLGRNVPEQRFDHYAGVGLHARGRTRIPRKTDGSRAERRRGCPDHPLLDGGRSITSWRWPSSVPDVCCGPTS